MRNHTYERLAAFLSRCSREELLASFSEPWMNEVIPGVWKLAGCNQGTKNHFEGDAAVHTSFVFENLSSTAKRRLGRMPDFIEQMSAVLHDLKKPETRLEDGTGGVTFPGHEHRAADEVASIAGRLDLALEEEERLLFVVARHGDAHEYLKLSAREKAELTMSPFIESLALLQEADALSCILPDRTHLPVFWEILMLKVP